MTQYVTILLENYLRIKKHKKSSKMENKIILNHAELLSQLAQLKIDREIQETALKYTFVEFIATINVVSFFKSANKTSSIQSNDLLKNGLSMVLNTITGLVLGKNRSVKGYLSTLFVERITTMLIDNDLINTISKIASLFSHKKESK